MKTGTRTLAFSAIMSGLAIYGQSATADVPLAQAVEAAQSAVATCKANGYSVTAMILEPDFSTRVVLRGDGAPEITVEVGRRKAYTVIKTGMSSGDFGKTVPAPPPAAAPPASGPPQLPGPVNGDPNLIPWAGGMPIKAGNHIVGAISVSGAPGGDKDEACAKAGLAALEGKLK
jgi:uncharacterized protein GlcG (DUF336 family)